MQHRLECEIEIFKDQFICSMDSSKLSTYRARDDNRAEHDRHHCKMLKTTTLPGELTSQNTTHEFDCLPDKIYNACQQL